MEAKEKAKELVEKFKKHTAVFDEMKGWVYSIDDAKQCALICVDEILKEHCHESENKNPLAQDRWIEFWQSVKQEINNL